MNDPTVFGRDCFKLNCATTLFNQCDSALITASDIDIVSVCVRVPYHRDLVLAALAADKHVYCEWPLGRDRGQAAEMADRFAVWRQVTATDAAA